MSPTDLELLELWRSRREPDAFSELVSRHAAMVHATSKRILGNEADAEDVAQECFFALARDDASVQTSIAGWLHRLATHRSLDLKRRDDRRRDRERRFVEAAGREKDPAWESIRALVDEAIEALPEDQSRLIVGHFLERETYEVLAERYGITRWVVVYRVKLGVQAIRRRLKRHGIALTSSALSALLGARMAEAAPASLLATLGRVALAGTTGSRARAAPAFLAARGPRSLAGARAAFPRLLAAALLVTGGLLVYHAFRSGDAKDASLPAAPRLAAESRPAAPAEMKVPTPPRAGSRALTSPIVVHVHWADTREPVGGAAVRLISLDEADPAVRETPTDARGSAEILHPAAWSRALVEVRHPRSGVQGFEVSLPAMEPLVCDIEPGFTVSGRLVEKADTPRAAIAPAAGVSVHLKPHPRRGRPEDSPLYEKAVTREDGRFAFAGIPRGLWFQLEIDPPGRALRTFSFRWADPRGRSVLDCGDILVEPGQSIVLAVTGPDGEPVIGAQVLAKRETDPWFTSAGLFESHREAAEVGPGRYSIERMLQGAPRIQVTAPGYALFRQYVHVPPGGEALPIRLDRGRVLAGAVASEDGAPLVGVEIDLEGPHLGLPHPRALSDDQGRFRFDVLGDGEYSIQASAGGYGRLTLKRLEPGQDRLLLHLVPEASYAGRILEESGRPLPNVEVSLAGRGESFRATADARGWFAVRGIHEGTYEIAVDGADLAPWMGGALTLKKGEAVDAGDLTLVQGQVVRGVVVNASTGLGVGGAAVILTLLDPSGQPILIRRLAHTLLDGNFSIRGVGEGDWKIVVKARGYLTGMPAPLRVGSEDVNGARLALEPGGSLSGRVFDSSGVPVDRASIRVACPLLPRESWSDLEALLKSASTQSGRDGAFTVQGLPPRDGYQLIVSHPEYAPGAACRIKVGPRGAVEDIRITLSSGGSVRGRIVAPDGRGIAGARVVASRQSPAGVTDPTRDECIASGADGRYALSPLSAGTWSLLARAPGRLPARVTGVSIGDGRVTDDVHLVLERGESLAGRVVDEEGRGIGAASVRIIAPSTGASGARTDPDGRFTVPGLPSGSVSLEVAMPGFSRQTFQAWLPSHEDLALPLGKAGRDEPPAGVRLWGLVSAEDAPLSEGVLVAAMNAEAPACRGIIDAFGGYQVELPVAGTYKVMVSSKDGVGSCVEVTVPPGLPSYRRDIDIPAAEVAPLLSPVD